MDSSASIVTGITLLAILIALAAIGAVIWAIASGKRQRRARHEELLGFGFTPVATAPPDLVDRVSAIRGSPEAQIPALRNVYHRAIAGGDAYLFDMANGGEGSSTSISGNLAVIAPTLKLPRLTLVPRLNQEGPMGGMLGRMAETALHWANTRLGMVPVTLDAMPAFAMHYIVMGRDANAVRACLTPARLSRLLAIDRKYAIEAEADTFLISAHMAAVTGVRDTGESLVEPYTLRMDAEALLALFRESPHTDRA